MKTSHQNYQEGQRERDTKLGRSGFVSCLKLPPVLAVGPQILKGCATPDVCNLPVNTPLGPEASGFHLTSPPECNNEAPPNPPGALNFVSLRPYPPCPPGIPLVLPSPACSQGILSPYYNGPRECNNSYICTHTHTPPDTPGSRKSHWYVATHSQTFTFISWAPKHTYRGARISNHEPPVA